MGLGITEAQISTALRAVDEDGDGVLDYEEFLRLMGEEFDVSEEADATLVAQTAAQAAKVAAAVPKAAQIDGATHTGAVAYKLSHKDRLVRQKSVVLASLGEKLAQKWSIFGEQLGDGIEALFKRLDRDGSGSISPQELSTVLRQLDLGLTEEQVEEVVAATDEDGDGQLNLEELLLGIKEAEGPSSTQALKEEFSAASNSSSNSSSNRTAAAAPADAKVEQNIGLSTFGSTYCASLPPERPMTAVDRARAAFETDMAEVMAVLDHASASRQRAEEQALPAQRALAFSVGRSRRSAHSARQRAPGAAKLVPWPPRPTTAPHPNPLSGPAGLVESVRSVITPPSSAARLDASSVVRLELAMTATSPRGGGGRGGAITARPSTTSSSSQQAGSRSARPRQGTGVPPPGRHRPLWSAREFGRNGLFYQGSASNPAQVPSSCYSATYRAAASARQHELERRGVSLQSGPKGLRKHLFASRTRFFHNRDELIRTRDGRIGSEFGPSTARLKPYLDRGEIPAKPISWQVHGRQNKYDFGRENVIGKDHPRHERKTLEYVTDVVEAGLADQILSHGTSPRSRRQYLARSPRALPAGRGFGSPRGRGGVSAGSGQLRAPEHVLPSSPRALIHMPFVN
eukprot:COSAG01_NODE_9153_length_2534_cov_21.192556_2_plen_629_part_00